MLDRAAAPPCTALWCVNVQGPDDIVAMPDYVSAIKVANKFNEFWLRMKQERGQTIHDPRMWATPIEWPGSAQSHAENLASPSEEYEAIIADALASRPEKTLFHEILAELVRARQKFPGKNVTFAALVEEVGELATATFEESRSAVRKESVQVAVMAMRMVLDGDHCFDQWRSDKGLDPLVMS